MSLWSPAVVTISVYSSSLQTLIVNVPRGSTGCSLLLWQYNLVVSVQCCVFHTQDCFVIGILCGKSGWIENFILKYKCTHSLGGFSTQSNKIQFISSLIILVDYSKILQLFTLTSLGTGYRWRLVDLCRWMFHCHSSKTLPECSGQYQNWIPPLKIQSYFTDLKEKNCNCSWHEGFSFQAPWFSQMFFLGWAF